MFVGSAKEKAYHPDTRDERQPFRGTTRISPVQAQLWMQTHPLTDNGVDRPTLLLSSSGNSREKARYCTLSGLHRPTLDEKAAPTSGSPIFAFFVSGAIVA